MDKPLQIAVDGMAGTTEATQHAGRTDMAPIHSVLSFLREPSARGAAIRCCSTTAKMAYGIKTTIQHQSCRDRHHHTHLGRARRPALGRLVNADHWIAVKDFLGTAG